MTDPRFIAGVAAGLKAAAGVAEARHEFWHMPHPDDALPFEVCDDESACRDIGAAIRAIDPATIEEDGDELP